MDKWRQVESKLTPQAARIDSERLIVTMEKSIKNIFYLICSPFQFPLYTGMDAEEPRELFRRFLALVGFAPHSEIPPLPKTPGVLDFFATVPLAVDQLYQYASGFNTGTDLIEDLILPYSLYIQKSSAFLDFPVSIVDSDLVLKNFISDRYSNAILMYRIRSRIEKTVRKSEYEQYFVKPLPEEVYIYYNTLTTMELAFLAGISYSYVIKLVKLNKFTGIKDKSNDLHIPITEIIPWIKIRKECPKWLKSLDC